MISSDFLFYVQPDSISDGLAVIEGQEASHIAQVLRHKQGDTLTFTNGKGEWFSGSLQQVSKKRCSVIIEEKHVGWDASEVDNYPVLCVGLMKKRQRLEFMIEKLIEIGVGAINLFHAGRSERSRTNTDRLQSVAQSAMKQSKRTVLPEIKIFDDLQDVLGQMNPQNDSLILLDQFAEVSGNDFLLNKTQQQKKRWAVIGPEGGLTEREISLCNDFEDASTIHIGNARLRAETAAIVAATYLKKS